MGELEEFNRNYRALKREKALRVVGSLFKGFAKAMPHGINNPDKAIKRPELYGINRKRRSIL